MKTDKKPVIGFICVILSCILVIGVTLGLLISANNINASAGSTADNANTTTDTTDTEEPPAEEPPAEEPVLKPELEWGFSNNYNAGCIDSLSGGLAYRSDKNTFDVEDVKLTIYYGDVFGSIEYERENSKDIPVFNISCSDPKRNRYLIREVNENFVSDEYRITRIYDENHRTKEIIFNHSEEIVIPKEVFSDTQGEFRLSISGINVRNNQYVTLAYAVIRYEMVGASTVQLSPEY